MFTPVLTSVRRWLNGCQCHIKNGIVRIQKSQSNRLVYQLTREAFDHVDSIGCMTLDVSGHYSRPDVFTFEVRHERKS